MTSRRGLLAATFVTLLTVTACTQSGGAGTGGASEPTAVGGGTTPAPSVDSASPAPAPTATAAASVAASAATSAAASAGADAKGACALISADEATGILGFAVKSTEQGQGGNLCIYEVPATGAIAAYSELSTVDAAKTFQTVKSASGVTPVEGIGDDAIWQPANLAVRLFILKGAAVLSLAVGTLSGVPIDEMSPETPPEELLEKAKKLGTLAASRM